MVVLVVGTTVAAVAAVLPTPSPLLFLPPLACSLSLSLPPLPLYILWLCMMYCMFADSSSNKYQSMDWIISIDDGVVSLR